MIFNLNNPTEVKVLKRGLEGMRVGITSGSFDFCHGMHIIYLKRCARYCDFLIVGVDSDDLVKERKGSHRPVFGEFNRILSVDSLDCVHATFILGSVDDFGKAVKNLGVNVIFKNEQFDKNEIVGREIAEVKIIPDIAQYSSTTEIVAALSVLPNDELASSTVMNAKP